MSQVVSCPKCFVRVSVSASQAGVRVQCPKCQQSFLAPSRLGAGGPPSGSAGDDDDWLILDDLEIGPQSDQIPSSASDSTASDSKGAIPTESKLKSQQGSGPTGSNFPQGSPLTTDSQSSHSDAKTGTVPAGSGSDEGSGPTGNDSSQSSPLATDSQPSHSDAKPGTAKPGTVPAGSGADGAGDDEDWLIFESDPGTGDEGSGTAKPRSVPAGSVPAGSGSGEGSGPMGNEFSQNAPLATGPQGSHPDTRPGSVSQSEHALADRHAELPITDPLPAAAVNTPNPPLFGANPGEPNLFADLPPIDPIMPVESPAQGTGDWASATAEDTGADPFDLDDIQLQALPDSPKVASPRSTPVNSPVADPLLDEAFASPSLPSTSAEPPTAISPQAEVHFTFSCPVCDSRITAKRANEGDKLRCSDCHSDLTIPKPPPIKQAKETSPSELESFALAPESQISRGAENDPWVKNADQLLEEAAKPESTKFVSLSADEDPEGGWMHSIGIRMKDSGVIAHLILLGAMMGAFTFLATSIHWLITVFTLPIIFVILVIVLVASFAIMMATANGHDQIDEWPTMDPSEWFDTMGAVLSAMAVTVAPIGLLAFLFGFSNTLVLGLSLAAMFSMFPIVLLSMLDAQSMTGIVSPTVIKSINHRGEDWGTFYLLSAFLLLVTIGLLVYLSGTSFGMGVFGCLIVAVFFVYFTLLGRLARGIQSVVHFEPLGKSKEDEDQDDG